MKSYIFPSSQKSLDLNTIVSIIENIYPNLKMNTFTSSQFPSQNQTIQVHGGIAIINNNGVLSFQIIFFETSDEWAGYSITQNNITLTYAPAVYSNIPTYSELQTLLQNKVFL